MKPIGLLAFLVLALAIPQPVLAQPIFGDFAALRKPVTLSYSTKEMMPTDTTTITTVIPERPGQSRRDRARVLNLTYQQKQTLVLAYRAGDHYGIGLLFAAVVYQESKLCADAKRSSTGALGCAQVEEVAAQKVTGATVPEWQLADPNLQDENMAIGARYLDLCLERFSYPAGIGCYYEGETRAVKLGRRRLSRLPYTKSVLANMKLLEQLPQSKETSRWQHRERLRYGLGDGRQNVADPNRAHREGGGGAVTRPDGKSRMDMLDWKAESFSPPVQTQPNGETSSPSGHISRQRLNPAFVCWLMGLPWWWTNIEHTSSDSAEMESYRSKLRQRLRDLLRGLGSDARRPT